MNTLSTFQTVCLLLSFLAGVLANAKQTGKFFGIVTEPAAWVPYVALAAAFLPAFTESLVSAGGFSVSALLNAVLAGIKQFGGLAAGVAAHHVFVAHTYGKSDPDNDNGGKPDDKNSQAEPAKPAA